MNPVAITFCVFASVFLGSLVGLALRRRLPEHHLAAESKDVVKMGAGFIGTMAALLLGLLVASAKSSYDTESSELTQMAAKFSFLDRVLAHYGPDANEAREMLRGGLARAIDQMWPEQAKEPAQLDPMATGNEGLYETLHALAPKTDEQQTLKGLALSTATDIGQLRWLLLAQHTSSISTPMLIVVIFWLTMIFMSFGLFASPNATVITTLLLCALSVSGAIFLIMELDQPFGGVIQISSTALRDTLQHLGK
jgi:hypothetical protein